MQQPLPWAGHCQGGVTVTWRGDRGELELLRGLSSVSLPKPRDLTPYGAVVMSLAVLCSKLQPWFNKAGPGGAPWSIPQKGRGVWGVFTPCHHGQQGFG